MHISPLQRFRVQILRLNHLTRGRLWFPHLPLAFLLAIGGVWLLQGEMNNHWRFYFDHLLLGAPDFPPAALPQVLIGAGMLTMAFGLLTRSRLAWVMALLLVLTATVSLFFQPDKGGHFLAAYFLLVLAGLLTAWRQFDRSSVAASTLFALTSVAMLLLYATFGTYYLGSQFKPPIKDLISALYYAVVSMSTVGYGDITPQTSEAKLFAVSIIVLGVAVFATSLTAVLVPVASRSFKGILNRGGNRMKREKHYIVIGNTPLAINTCRELAQRGQPVTRLLREAPIGALGDVDLVTGEPSNVDVLREAGAEKAAAVLAMLDDDSENAFVVLAMRELQASVRTVVAVNDSQHLNRLQLVQPDVIIAPQILGGELAAMMMCGEEVTSDFVMKRVFQQGNNTKT